MKRFQIKYTGETMDKFPETRYCNCPATADAYEVLDWNGASRIVGTIDMCEAFVRSYFQQ